MQLFLSICVVFKKYNMKELERILRERTFNMFKDDWYKNTVSEILTNKSNRDNMDNTIFSIFEKEVVIGEKTPTKKMKDIVLACKNIKEISDKKIIIELKSWSIKKGLRLDRYNTNGIRGFVIY